MPQSESLAAAPGRDDRTERHPAPGQGAGLRSVRSARSVTPFAIHAAEPDRRVPRSRPAPQVGRARRSERPALQGADRSTCWATRDSLTIDDGVPSTSRRRPGQQHAPAANGRPRLRAGTPITNAPSTDHNRSRSDFARVLGSSGPRRAHSETPPGHWNTIANSVSGQPRSAERIGGTDRSSIC